MNGLTIEPNTIIEAEAAFIAARDASYLHVSETCKAAVRYGGLVIELRQQCKSDKDMEAKLLELGAKLPIHETKGLMKVAARAQRQGKQLFLDRGSMTWAQSEMGLLPPNEPKGKRDVQHNAGDAIKALGKAAAIVKDVCYRVSFAHWTEEERRLMLTSLEEIKQLCE